MKPFIWICKLRKGEILWRASCTYCYFIKVQSRQVIGKLLSKTQISIAPMAAQNIEQADKSTHDKKCSLYLVLRISCYDQMYY
ncbi:Dolichyl-diphosphooligosaccharide--protein glycosyltransferase subunit STT3A [Frankliniella fusca]|uniref:Dolichyl-diphosphooligosaccharide--protein glycosyltransferase subunit STT3A n=1 Tax=Frankliniella fusca TaxID=407009 RepID=A0AAE1HQD4_9NEOP|nr:Dolichyl-diphosphooligosaccharide--protein glycosyltransferase subunit STT3A [Frankliniella fusca]